MTSWPLELGPRQVTAIAIYLLLWSVCSGGAIASRVSARLFILVMGPILINVLFWSHAQHGIEWYSAVYLVQVVVFVVLPIAAIAAWSPIKALRVIFAQPSFVRWSGYVVAYLWIGLWAYCFWRWRLSDAGTLRDALTNWRVPATLLPMHMITAPLLEEIYYRGFLWAVSPETDDKEVAKLIFTSLAFSALHLGVSARWVTVVGTLFLGLIYGFVRSRVGLKWAILCHMAANIATTR